MSEEAKTPEMNEEPVAGGVPLSVEPDMELVETVAAWGGGDLKACFQCATCSVVCPLSPEENPFPRKEIVGAQWGMKDRLVSDPDLWLCHRCNDCSDNCPRGAKTGDVMAALRSYAYQHHAWPGFLGRWLNKPAMLPAVLAIPALLIWALIAFAGNMEAPTGIDAGKASMYWGNMIEPWPWLDLGFIVASIFAVLCLARGVMSVWKGFMGSGVQADLTPKMSLQQAIVGALIDIVVHRKFAQCGAAHARRWVHMLILFGFAGLFATTALVFIGMYTPGIGLQTPLPLNHPIKLLGNASAITIAIGLIIAIARRANPEMLVQNGRNAYQDVLFLSVITLTVATGILSQVFRLGTVHGAAAASYYLHLVLTFFLIVFAPFSKFAHVVYHSTAVVWGKYVGRELNDLAATEGMTPAATVTSDDEKAA